MANLDRNRTWARLVAGWVICGAGCGIAAMPAQTVTAAKPAIPVTAATEFAGDVVPSEIAAEPFAEVKRYAFTLLHFQRMQQLQEDAVQQSLKLSKAQIQAFRKEGAEAKRLISELQSVSAADRETAIEKKFVPKAKQYQQLIDGELSEEQQAQLLRRVAQTQRGAIVLLLPGIPEHLEMTDKQHAAICRIVDENRKAFSSEGISNNPLELIKLSRRAAQSRSAAEAHLNDEQKSRWAAMLKEPRTK